MKYNELKTIKARVTYLKIKLSSDYNWAVRGMLRVFDKQTASEQASEETRDWNNVGFTGSDASLLSSFSKQVQNGRQLSDKQQEYLFKKMPKYARQLEKITRGVA